MSAPIALTVRRTARHDEADESSTRTETAQLLNMINNLAPGYDPTHLKVQGKGSEAILHQISSHKLHQTPKPADPTLKDYEKKARETRRPEFKIRYPSRDNLQRCLVNHPLTSDSYLKEKKIIEKVSLELGSEPIKKGDAVLVRNIITEQTKIDEPTKLIPITMRVMKAVESCSIEPQKAMISRELADRMVEGLVP